MGTKVLTTALIVVLSGSVLGAGEASASEPGSCTNCTEELLLPLSIVADLFGTIGAIGTFTYVVKWNKSPAAWRTFGYITAAADLAVGGVLLAYALDEGSSFKCGNGAAALWALGIGAADLGFTLWTSVRPDRPSETLAISPIVLRDRNGGAVAGVGLTLVGW